MRLHTTDKITRRVLMDAVEFATATAGGGHVFLDGAMRQGSRSHAGSWDVRLTGDGTINKRRVNPGARDDVSAKERAYTATWDSWGCFLAYLYVIDPDILVGSKANPIYKDAAHFHARTEGAYKVTRDFQNHPIGRFADGKLTITRSA